MSPSPSIAASLPPDFHQKLSIEVLSKSKPVSHLAREHRVSRKFLYQQGNKAKQALAEWALRRAGEYVNLSGWNCWALSTSKEFNLNPFMIHVIIN